MKVAMLVPTLDDRAGGITTVVQALQVTYAEAGTEARKFAPHGGQLSGWARVGGLVAQAWDFAPQVVHTHGMWVGHALAGKRLAQQHRIPEVISPHGMLDPWAMRNRAWKKRLMWQLFERTHLRQASVIHALCEPERRAIRALGIKTPIALIPNGVTLPRTEPAAKPVWADVFHPQDKVLLFLGRIHPKKGLAELIDAWAALPKAITAAGWRLAIVGWDDGGHLANYQHAIDAHGIGATCRLFGPTFGEAKAATLKHAAGFILPSFSEGLPMSVLEAWANRLPVLMTPECNLPEGFAAKAAFQIDTVPTKLATQIAEVLGGPEARLREAGENGRRLVEEGFTWTQVARQFHDVYRWLLDSGPKPALVTVGSES